MTTTIAVLTGDLVNSTGVANPGVFMQRLQALLQETETRYAAKTTLFRGDSFQITLPAPLQALECMLMLRSGLIAASPSRNERWDTRIAVAIAAADSKENSYGAAYIQSGRGLDKIDRDHFYLYAEPPLFRLAAGLATAFVDDIVSQWTAAEAEAYYTHLQYPGGHQAIADQLGKSRSTITKTLLRARYNLIDRYIADVNQLMEQTRAC